MSLYILDTDHISLFLSGNRAIKNKIAHCVNDIAITIIQYKRSLMGGLVESIIPSQQAALAISIPGCGKR